MTNSKGQQRRIRVSRLTVQDGKTVNVQFELSEFLRRFFFKTYTSVTYDRSVADLPEGILIIPFLSLIMPVAWVLDAIVEVDRVDAVFADALERIRARFQTMYPEVPFRGKLVVSQRTSIETPTDPVNGVLCSGGIDSTATIIHHKDEPLLLFSVIPDRDELKGFANWLSNYNSSFGQMMGVESHVVHADLHTVFDAPLVCAKHKQFIHDWWAGIQHSLYFSGACAPLATLRGVTCFYIPSSHSVGMEAIRWGSHPVIDNEIAWGKTHVVHDLYNLGRQGKIAIIADFLRGSGKKPTICVCEKLKDVGGKNCSQCEKCCRTMIGLALAGLDPNEFGFSFDQEALARIKEKICAGELLRNENELSFWAELKRSVDAKIVLQSYGMPEFASWLQGADLFVNENIAKRQVLYREIVRWCAILPRFIRRPLREFVLRVRGIPQ